MRRSPELERRLVEWGREYGGGRYEDIGYSSASPLATLMLYHGPAPQGLQPRTERERTPADDVEHAVAALQRQRSGYVPAMIIRAEYTLPGQPVESKIGRLRRIGVSLPQGQYGRVRYSQMLLHARIHVSASLGIALDADDIVTTHTYE